MDSEAAAETALDIAAAAMAVVTTPLVILVMTIFLSFRDKNYRDNFYFADPCTRVNVFCYCDIVFRDIASMFTFLGSVKCATRTTIHRLFMTSCATRSTLPGSLFSVPT